MVFMHLTVRRLEKALSRFEGHRAQPLAGGLNGLPLSPTALECCSRWRLDGLTDEVRTANSRSSDRRERCRAYGEDIWDGIPRRQENEMRIRAMNPTFRGQPQDRRSSKGFEMFTMTRQQRRVAFALPLGREREACIGEWPECDFNAS